VGGGIETFYEPENRPTRFFTRNYYAHDIAIDTPQRRDRYRFQGTFYECIGDSLSINGVYDFVSDGQMAADYQTKDFELYTAEKTEVELRHKTPHWIANLFTRVRVNNFQDVNQELPSFQMNWHPIAFPQTGILFENAFQAGFYHYVFSQKVKEQDFHAGRVSASPRLSRPFYWGPLIATPEAGFIGIGYTNSPGGKSAGQALGEIGFKLETALTHAEERWKHVLEPYAHYKYFTEPTVPYGNYYIFTIQDGYHQLNYLRLGCRNALFLKTPLGIINPLWVDLWTYAFFAMQTIPDICPKGYLNIDWQPHSRLFLGLESAWNFQHQLIDYYNARGNWTVNEYLAIGVEYRHRSAYDWRKADFYNFMLEATQPEGLLYASTLSDRRDAFLFRTFFRFTPDQEVKFSLRTGWNRKQLNSYYLEYEVEYGMVFFQHWRFAFICEKRESDFRSSISFKLKP